MEYLLLVVLALPALVALLAAGRSRGGVITAERTPTRPPAPTRLTKLK